jgi:1-acyl-sn-glycerol-3-phosphate acyltransferase
VIFIRSLLFNLLFYLVVLVLLALAVPTLALPPRAMLGIARIWARWTLWLLRNVARIDVVWSGLDRIPPGGILVAAKHQSALETVVLASAFPNFTFVVKRELFWLPIFGWCIRRGGMIPVDRGGGKAAVAALTAEARKATDGGRQIIIFPEGTRRPPGAPPKYKQGIAYLYEDCNAPCVPVALNTGVFWPRRSFMRYPGTARIEILDPIPPGRDRADFFAAVEGAIEAATARLVAEGKRELAAAGIRTASAEPESDISR